MAICFLSGNLFEPEIVIGWGEPVVVKAMIGEEYSGMAVKAVCSVQTDSGVIFGHEELEAFLFLFGQFALVFSCAIEFGV